MLQDNIKSAAVLHKDEILIPPRGRKARTHTRMPHVPTHRHRRDRIIFIMNTAIPLASRLWLCINIFCLFRSALERAFPPRGRETGGGLGVCLREVANFYFIKWRAWNRSGSMELGHLKNVLPYPGYEMWVILRTLLLILVEDKGIEDSRYASK